MGHVQIPLLILGGLKRINFFSLEMIGKPMVFCWFQISGGTEVINPFK